jgi:hypothetical protein
MERRRNEGGRFSKGSDWYASIESETIAKIEQEWQLKQACEEYYTQLDEECAADELAERYEASQAA